MRHFNLIENLLCELDMAVRTLIKPPSRTARLSPAAEVLEGSLSSTQSRHVAALMRVNHAGEVCAQALYRGQALMASDSGVKTQMAKAAEEEIDHLAWCEQRLAELNSKPSVLNPLWYFGSLMIGIAAGLVSDKVSLGFLAETEKQVADHLQGHLDQLPFEDDKTKAILLKMHEEESHHATRAMDVGAAQLPEPIKEAMRKAAKLMTVFSYYV